MAAGLVPDGKEKTQLPLGAPTATDVAANISRAMSTLGNDTYDEEDKAAQALRSLARALETERRKSLLSNTSGPFAVATPALADATPAQIIGGGFRPAR